MRLSILARWFDLKIPMDSYPGQKEAENKNGMFEKGFQELGIGNGRYFFSQKSRRVLKSILDPIGIWRSKKGGEWLYRKKLNCACLWAG